MELNRLTTQLNPAGIQHKKTVPGQADIKQRLHPEGLPADIVDAPVPQDLAIRMNPPELQPESKAAISTGAKEDIAGALNPLGLPAPAPAPVLLTNFHEQLNPPELQPQPGPPSQQEPVNIRQILDSPQGRVAENQTGSLTFLP